MVLYAHMPFNNPQMLGDRNHVFIENPDIFIDPIESEFEFLFESVKAGIYPIESVVGLVEFPEHDLRKSVEFLVDAMHVLVELDAGYIR